MASTSLCPHLVQEYFKRIGEMAEAYKSQMISFVDYRKINIPLLERKIIRKEEHDVIMRLPSGEEKMAKVLEILQRRMWGFENLITALIETDVESWLVEEMFQKYVHYVVNEIRRLQDAKRCQCYENQRRSLIRKALIRFFQVCDTWLYTIGTHLGFLDQTIYPCRNVLQAINNLLPMVREKEETITFPEIEPTPLCSLPFSGGNEVTITEVHSDNSEQTKPPVKDTKQKSASSVKTSATLNGRLSPSGRSGARATTTISTASQRAPSTPRLTSKPSTVSTNRLSLGATKSIRPVLRPSSSTVQQQQEQQQAEQTTEDDNKVLPTTTVAVPSIDENMNTMVVYLPVHLPLLPNNHSHSFAHVAEKPLEDVRVLLDPVKLQGLAVIQDTQFSPESPRPMLSPKTAMSSSELLVMTPEVPLGRSAPIPVSQMATHELANGAADVEAGEKSPNIVVNSEQIKAPEMQKPSPILSSSEDLQRTGKDVSTMTDQDLVSPVPVDGRQANDKTSTVDKLRKTSSSSATPASSVRKVGATLSTPTAPTKPLRKLTPLPASTLKSAAIPSKTSPKSGLSSSKSVKSSTSIAAPASKEKKIIVSTKSSSKPGSRSSLESLNSEKSQKQTGSMNFATSESDLNDTESLPGTQANETIGTSPKLPAGEVQTNTVGNGEVSIVTKVAANAVEPQPAISPSEPLEADKKLNNEENNVTNSTSSHELQVKEVTSPQEVTAEPNEKPIENSAITSPGVDKLVIVTTETTPEAPQNESLEQPTTENPQEENNDIHLLQVNHPIFENMEVTLVTIPEEAAKKVSVTLNEKSSSTVSSPVAAKQAPKTTATTTRRPVANPIPKRPMSMVTSSSRNSTMTGRNPATPLRTSRTTERYPISESTRRSGERKISTTGITAASASNKPIVGSRLATTRRTSTLSVSTKPGISLKANEKPGSTSPLPKPASTNVIKKPAAGTVKAKTVEKGAIKADALKVYHGAWADILESDVNLFKSSASFPSAFTKKLKLPSLVDCLAHMLDRSQSLPSVFETPDRPNTIKRPSISESMLTAIGMTTPQLARTLAQSKKDKGVSPSKTPKASKFSDAASQTVLRPKTITATARPPTVSSPAARTIAPRTRTKSASEAQAPGSAVRKASQGSRLTKLSTTTQSGSSASENSTVSSSKPQKVAAVLPNTRPAWNMNTKKPAAPQPPPVLSERFSPFTIEDYNFQQWANEWSSKQEKKKNDSSGTQSQAEK